MSRIILLLFVSFILLPPVSAQNYSNINVGLFPFVADGKWGYVNEEGKVTIPFQYEMASDFFNGIARVQVDLHFGFIDRKSKLLTKLYKKAFNFPGGLAIIEIEGKRGFIDIFDEIAIKPIFDDSDGFSQGLAAVRIGGKYGYIDRSGGMAVKPQFDSACWF